MNVVLMKVRSPYYWLGAHTQALASFTTKYSRPAKLAYGNSCAIHPLQARQRPLTLIAFLTSCTFDNMGQTHSWGNSID